MYTLDIKKRIKRYILFTLIILVFGIIYECFSFGVVSIYMIGAFLIPLVFGVIISTGLYLLEGKPNKLSVSTYNNGVITLTVGSIIKGVLDIYGTTNNLITVYLVVGLALILFGLIFFLIELLKVRSN